MVLSFFGKLVDPTNQYSSATHKFFSECLVGIITLVVGNVTTLAFVTVGLILLGLMTSTFELDVLANSWVLTIIGIWFLIEVLFYFYCLFLRRKLEAPMSLPMLSPDEKILFVEKVLEHWHDPWSGLVRWFRLHPPEEIGVECVETWLSWAFFGKLSKDLNFEERKELRKLEEKTIAKHPELGRPAASLELNFMRLHLDEVVVQHKPFVAYLVISGMQILGTLFLSHLGFERHILPGSRLSYWTYGPPPYSVKPHIAKSATKEPIFIIHGIGIGIAMYYKLVKAVVSEDPYRPVFILELPHISLKVTSRIPSFEETLEAVDEIYHRHSLKSSSWLAHSYGTIVTTWILKERPHFVSKVTYIDPVCFALWEPDLIYNFLYKRPQSPIDRLCQFFVAQDLVIASTLFRNFSWIQNISFPEEILCPAQVFLSSHDFIINPESIYDYLERHNDKVKKGGKGRVIGLTLMEGLAHGGIISSDENISIVTSHV